MKKITIIFLLLCSLSACERFVEIGAPRTESVTSTVYSNDAGATSVVRGIYHEIIRSGFASGLTQSITILTALSSDEFINYNATNNEFATNTIAPASLSNSVLWTSGYKAVYNSNAAIEGITASTGVTSSTRNQLLGEAKFLRAFALFSLMNLYGEIPLPLSADYRVNATLSRSSTNAIVAQVIQDLKEAQLLLSADFQFTGGERVRVTAPAAAAMLARVYLYGKDWANAEAASGTVIANSLFKLPTDLTTCFLKNSSEAIWQLMPIVPNQNTNEAIVMVPQSATALPASVSISQPLISSFEVNDKRKVNWTGTQVASGTTFYYPFKYRVFRTGQPVTEYSMVLRLAEQYLIRAEARVQLGKFPEAISDLDVVRTRAGLPSIATKIPAPNASNLMAAIEQERRVELFGEWGHRWFDLKRWNRAEAVLTPLKPTFSKSALLYPIPQSELASDPNLAPQNPGY